MLQRCFNNIKCFCKICINVRKVIQTPQAINRIRKDI